ncbi:MAG: GNAT family N-acetyltransferase [Chitinophagaceae bacterium]|nr:MAG: GNAT family N-acetyltransferase [Chitinophagaceae bacterium]
MPSNSTHGFHFRKATPADLEPIWVILQHAIERRRLEGSNQWQDGYPNPTGIGNDIEHGHGYVLTEGEAIAGYCAILVNDEAAYADIQGKWLSNGDFVVYHRVALSPNYLGKGLAAVLLAEIEKFAMGRKIYSLKADTNFDNKPMLHLFEKMGYVYCGEVFFRGAPRKAFEKLLRPID